MKKEIPPLYAVRSGLQWEEAPKSRINHPEPLEVEAEVEAEVEGGGAVVVTFVGRNFIPCAIIEYDS